MTTKNIFRSALAAMAALTLAGCNKQDPQTQIPELDYGNLRFEVVVGDKTDYEGDDPDTRAVKQGWAQDDEILVYFDGTDANSLWLKYDAQNGWQQTEDNITSLSANGGSVQALHADDLVYGFVPDKLSVGDNMLFTDAGTYTIDGQTVRVTLPMNERITSRVTVEGFTDSPVGWMLTGPDFSVRVGAAELADGAFNATGKWADALATYFQPSDFDDFILAGSVLSTATTSQYYVMDRGTTTGTTFYLHNWDTGKSYSRTYTDKELTPGKAITIQGPESAEADQWTLMGGGDTKSITLSAQKNAVTVGTGGDANYDLSMTGISVSNSLYFSTGATVTWYNAASGGTSIAVPTGVIGYNYTRETDSKGVFSVKLGPAISAGEYFFTVTYEGATSDRTTLTVSPAGGGDTGYAVGDYWPNSTAPEGIVFWVKPGTDGAEGKVVGLGETYVAKWGPDNDEEAAGVTGIRSFTNGAMATKSMVAKYKGSATFSTDYPAFHYVYNTVNGGAENGAWYLPAVKELEMLCAGYCGKVYENISDWEGQSMPDYDSPECVTARAAFDAKLTAKGGKAIGSSGNPFAEWYLSSTELESTTSISFGFEDGSHSSDYKNFDGNIRWIREF